MIKIQLSTTTNQQHSFKKLKNIFFIELDKNNSSTVQSPEVIVIKYVHTAGVSRMLSVLCLSAWLFPSVFCSRLHEGPHQCSVPMHTVFPSVFGACPLACLFWSASIPVYMLFQSACVLVCVAMPILARPDQVFALLFGPSLPSLLCKAPARCWRWRSRFSQQVCFSLSLGRPWLMQAASRGHGCAEMQTVLDHTTPTFVPFGS